MSELSEKVVLITGASSGIGAATARELAGHGAMVMLGARRTGRLAELAEELGERVAYRALDVTDAEDFHAFADAAQTRFGRIDVLVNNAGIMPLSPLAALQHDEWERTIAVNVGGVLNGIAAVLPGFTRRQAGHVVNVASLGAHHVVPSAAVYCATKFAVWAITDGLRQEHKDLRATIISPGVVRSELADGITDPTARAAMQAFREIAIGPDAIARAIRFAIVQPDDVDVSEIIVRPTASTVI
jgi:NADP-dependent 3-hydroxy acid dehydrogenase YdfG